VEYIEYSRNEIDCETAKHKLAGDRETLPPVGGMQVQAGKCKFRIGLVSARPEGKDIQY
jgi:hypothetical protein